MLPHVIVPVCETADWHSFAVSQEQKYSVQCCVLSCLEAYTQVLIVFVCAIALQGLNNGLLGKSHTNKWIRLACVPSFCLQNIT